MTDLGPQVAAAMRAKLAAALAPDSIEITDDSHRHAGHAGAQAGGGTHFRVTVVSKAFAGHSRVQRQRLVYDVLAAELKGRVHALSLMTLTPEEASSSGVTRKTAI
jgi:BolA protein